MPSFSYSLALTFLLSGAPLAQGQAAHAWDALPVRAPVRSAAYQGASAEDNPTAGASAARSPSPGELHRAEATHGEIAAHREVGTRESRKPASHPLSAAEGAATRSTGPVVTMLASLAAVLGVFLLVTWFVRRHLPRGAGPLPTDVLEVLGRATIGHKQPLSLLRLGDRLLLVAIHPAGAETLAEITDPDEVTRLVGLCRQAQPQSASGAFRQVLQQMSNPQRATKAEDRHA